MRTATVRTTLASTIFGLATLCAAGDASASPPCDAIISATNCRDAGFRETCHHEAECAPILQAGFEASFSTAVPIQRYEDGDDEKSLVSGRKKRHLISGPRLLSPGGLASYAGLEGRAHALAQSSSVTPSAAYTRSPSFLSNGVAIASCSEYVYEKYYDYMRFIDASNSCKDDAECIVDMAYSVNWVFGYPSPVALGIADRQMKGRGDASQPAIELPDIPLTNGIVPKNAFYNGAILMTPTLVSHLTAAFPAGSAGLSQLAGRLYGGSNYYKWGVPSAVQPASVASYADEWDYHRDMRAKTAAIPPPEGAANRKRMAQFEGLLAGFFEQAYCTGLHGVANCVELPELAPTNHLLERIGGDPFIRNVVLGSEVLRKQALTFTLGEMAFRLTPNGNGLVSQQVFMDVGMPSASLPGAGGLYLMDPSNPIPSVDPSSLWSDSLSIGHDLDTMWGFLPPAVDATSPTPLLDCEADQAQLEAPNAYRLAACQATNLLLREWSRDNPGCVDAGYPGCDWQASMFVDRFATTQLYMPERTEAYNECVRWTLNSFGSVLVPGVVPAFAKANVQALESFLEDRRLDFESFEAPRELDANDRVVRFGESKSDSVQLGDQDSFGGGYAYTAGWSSTPLTHQNSRICRVDFTADASFQAWATGLGQRADIIDTGAHVRANTLNNGQATFQRNLLIADEEFITNASQAVNVNGLLSTTLTGDEESTTIYENTIILGYGLYVDIEIEAEYSVGVVFASIANVPATNGCMTQSGMDAMAMVQPFARASVVGSLYGGWMGIVEAGLEAELDLIKATLPITARGEILPGSDPQVRFDLSGDLTLTTLSGHVDVCGCFLVFCGCQELVSWPGQDLGTFEVLTPVHDQAALTGM